MAEKNDKTRTLTSDAPDLTPEEKEFIDAIQVKIHFKKGEIILSEGQISLQSYHVLQGCIRKYYLKDGEEKTIDFFIEDDAISNSTRKSPPTKSKYFLEALEDTTVYAITAEQEEILYNKFPRFQGMCRISTEALLEEYQEKLSKFMSSTPEERYVNLMETRPDLLNRVPQYQLASYLGVKPESLSRIRKRLMG